MSSVAQNSTIPANERFLLTGSAHWPDVESVFIKDASGEVHIHDGPMINSLGHNPCEFYTAIERIQVATSALFKEIKENTLFNENSELGNALKNLGRGLVQLVPLAGNAALIIYDQIRIAFFVNPSIKRALAEIQEPVVGVAFDGKPVFTVPVRVANASFSGGNPDDVFACASYMWAALRHRQFNQFIEKDQLITTRELAHRFERHLNTPYIGPRRA